MRLLFDRKQLAWLLSISRSQDYLKIKIFDRETPKLPTKIIEAKHLDIIYDSCQSTTFDKFCIGQRGWDNGFPEGTDCLGQRNCQALLTGHRNGKKIEWLLLLALDKEAAEVRFVVKTPSKVGLHDVSVRLKSDDDKAVVGAIDDNFKEVAIDSTNNQDMFKFVDSALIERATPTSPRILMARLTSPTVIRFVPISWNVDTSQETTTSLEHISKSGIRKSSYAIDTRMFDRATATTTTTTRRTTTTTKAKKTTTTTTTTKKPTKPTKTPKTKKPKNKSNTRFPGRPTTNNSSSRLTGGRAIGLITLAAIAVLVSMCMQ